MKSQTVHTAGTQQYIKIIEWITFQSRYNIQCSYVNENYHTKGGFISYVLKQH